MEVNIEQFLNCDESDVLEYKEEFNKDSFGISLAAFSTHRGGHIIIGVKDDGTPVGISMGKGFSDKLQSISKEVGSNIQFKKFEHLPGKEILLVRVHEGHAKPYAWKKVYYTRSNATCEKLGKDDITNMNLESKEKTFDGLRARIGERDAYISDIDEKKVIDFIEDVESGKRGKKIGFTTVKNFLRNENLLESRNFVKNAAILAFGKSPNISFPNSKINLLVYSGNDIRDNDLENRTVIEGTIINQIKKAESFILNRTQNKVMMNGFKRIEINQFPESIIRESIVNAIAHRDYSEFKSAIIIRLFQNRLEIENPGNLIGDMTLRNIKEGGHSIQRNRFVCKILDSMGLMEQSGQGIKNIINTSLEYELPEPEISVSGSFFKINLIGQKLSPTISVSSKIIGTERDLTPVLTTKQQKGLNFIQTNTDNFVTIKGYREGIEISHVSARKHLKMFEKLGIIKKEIRNNKIFYKKVANNI